MRQRCRAGRRSRPSSSDPPRSRPPLNSRPPVGEAEGGRGTRSSASGRFARFGVLRNARKLAEEAAGRFGISTEAALSASIARTGTSAWRQPSRDRNPRQPHPPDRPLSSRLAARSQSTSGLMDPQSARTSPPRWASRCERLSGPCRTGIGSSTCRATSGIGRSGSPCLPWKPRHAGPCRFLGSLFCPYYVRRKCLILKQKLRETWLPATSKSRTRTTRFWIPNGLGCWQFWCCARRAQQ